ncbi:MAG: hypothetical protein NC078_08115 [Ruminococcus sp.]|nr:hypothetical protein [Ruminococcus sp.]
MTKLRPIPALLTFSAFLALFLLSSCKPNRQADEPFTGLPAEHITFGFSPGVNRKAFDQGLFCYDDLADADNIYFSDPARDFNLCQYDGNTVTRITDFPAIGLNFSYGCVYFVRPETPVNIEDKTGSYGVPYKYDPHTNVTEKIGDTPIQSMTLIDGEIYGVDMENSCYVYKYPDKTPLFNSFDVRKTGDYFLAFETHGDNLRFYLQSDTDRRFLFDGDIITESFFAYGKLYFRTQETHELRSVDLSNGETALYCEGGINDFTVCGGELYIIAGDGFLYSRRDGGLVKLNFQNQYSSLYSDSENLYAVAKRYDPSTGRMSYSFAKLDENYEAVIIDR